MSEPGNESSDIFEHVGLGGGALADLEVRPYWVMESPEFGDDPYWGAPTDMPRGGPALFVSGPSRNGNHLIHSMLDGHPELCSVPGEDSFLPAFFEELLADPAAARENLCGPDNVEYILYLTGWGINKRN